VQHVIHALDRRVGDCRLGQIAVREFDAGLQVAFEAGNQAIDNPDPMATCDQRRGQVRSDEARSTGDEICRHAPFRSS